MANRVDNIPYIAIVGRPNVGKSTLFNRLVGWKKALTDNRPGTTRDIHTAKISLDGRHFILADTGGVSSPLSENSGGTKIPFFTKEVTARALASARSASLILFVVDGQTGLTAEDRDLFSELRQCGIPLMPIVNKMDSLSPEKKSRALEFCELGIKEPLSISAEHNKGIGELKEKITESIGGLTRRIQESSILSKREGFHIKVTIVGRPNVGKSTLLNALLEEERSVVSDIPNTTTDPVAGELTVNDTHYLFVDTAGLKKKSRTVLRLEIVAGSRSVSHMKEGDIVLWVVDVREGITAQDVAIASLAYREGRGLIVVLNKWDLLAEEEKDIGYFKKTIAKRAPFYHNPPLLPISALKKRGLQKIFTPIALVAREFNKILDPSLVATASMQWRNNGPLIGCGLTNIRQVAGAPPFFEVQFRNQPSESTLRYLKRRIHETFGFDGVPILFKNYKQR